MFFRTLFLSLFISLAIANARAQVVTNDIYLVGNIANTKNYEKIVSSIHAACSKEGKHTIVLLGDLTDEDGMDKTASAENIKRLEAFAKLGTLENTNLIFLGGDRDWDDTGEAGNLKINNLEKFISKKLDLKDSFLPKKGCPGPEEIELSDDLVLIAINSQWFIHPFERPEAPDTDCDILTPADFWEELSDIVDDNENRNILILAHHPTFSNGYYSGNSLPLFNLIPVVGTVYYSFRKQIGTYRDFANDTYKEYNKNMRKMLSDHASLIYASGHEHHNAIQKIGDNFFVHSSASEKRRNAKKDASTLFKSTHPGYTRLSYYDDGSIASESFSFKKYRTDSLKLELLASPCKEQKNVNEAFNPCKGDQDFSATEQFVLTKKDTAVVAGKEYYADKIWTYWMGEQYRAEWTQDILVDFIDINKIHKGLTPYAKGGGLQTNSLKFRSGNGKRFAFRSVNKNPERALSEEIKKTFYKDITKDLITSQHPYGILVASELMGAAKILHAKPQLFVMPDHPRLGIYRQEFKGVLGTLEEKPKGKNKTRKGFANADKVVASNQMFRSLYKSHNNRIDKKAYAKARLFDLWVGDWDRHEDNWIWARYEAKKGNRFVPIPKDRDHVFSSWTGLIPRMADMIVMNAEHFGYHFGNMNHLSFKARHLDRQLAQGLTREDWLEEANKLKATMTDEVIENSFDVWPKEIFDLKGEIIITKLKSRRDELEKAANDIYDLLAKEVDIVGSNKREWFEVSRNKDGTVLVEMFDTNDKEEKKERLYSRLFYPNETKVINLFGLSGRDLFFVSGEAKRSIRIRIVGGDKKDKITDTSLVKRGERKTRIYDQSRQDIITGGKETLTIHPVENAEYDNKAFQYDALSVLPSVRRSSGNGLGLILGVGKLYKGFNKPDFAHKFNVQGTYYRRITAYRIKGDYWHRQFLGKYDFHSQGEYSHLNASFPFYYGIGNDSKREEALSEVDFYRINYEFYRLKLGVQQKFWKKSHLHFYNLYELHQVKAKAENSIFDLPENDKLSGLGDKFMFGIEAELHFDFRDNPKFTKEGSSLLLNFRNYVHDEGVVTFASKAAAVLSHYKTFHIFSPTTFVVSTGYLGSFFDTPFYLKSALGSNSYLRGHVRNRYLDDHALFLNLETRVHIATIPTALAPFNLGIYGFWDQGVLWGQQELDFDNLHEALGVGIYMAPLKEQYNISIYFSSSEDRGNYVDFRFGWRLQ